MKTLKPQSLVLFCSAALLLASCSSVKQNNVFLKRKYFDFSRKNQVVMEPKAAKETPSKAVEIQRIQQAAPVISSNNVQKYEGTSRLNEPIPLSTTRVKAMQCLSQAKPNPDQNTSITLVDKGFAKAKITAPAYITDDKEKSDNSISVSNPVLLIILAILISPLAVYLYDKAATTRFWIDLILWLLGVGVGFGVFVFAGLLWLVAVIYALLIVTGSIK